MERDSKRIVKRLKAEGFELISIKGSHHKFRKGDKTVIVPHPKKDLPNGTARSIARQAGLDIGENEMRIYVGVVHKDMNSAYGVHFPDVPGCFSAADTFEDVIPNAVEALSLFFEDAEAIEPRDLSAIKDVAAEDLREGATLIAVPHVTTSQKQERVNISMQRGMLEAIDQSAKARGLTRSAFLAEAARNEIEGRH